MLLIQQISHALTSEVQADCHLFIQANLVATSIDQLEGGLVGKSRLSCWVCHNYAAVSAGQEQPAGDAQES